MLADWDNIEKEVRSKVDKEIQAKSQYTKQTLAAYKDYVENHHITRKVENIDWNSSEISAYKQETQCDMKCVDFCFSAEKFMTEDVERVYELCLVAQCNCATGEVSYEVKDSE